MIAKNIKWDTDGNSELLDILPKEVVIPNSITDEDEISDWLSDEYSFCHLGFDIASDFTNWLIETGYLDPEDIYSCFRDNHPSEYPCTSAASVSYNNWNYPVYIIVKNKEDEILLY